LDVVPSWFRESIQFSTVLEFTLKPAKAANAACESEKIVKDFARKSLSNSHAL
jgi:hypothetical protein